MQLFVKIYHTYWQLVKVDAIEGEVLVIDGVQGPSQHPRLHLVLLFWQQLQLHIRVAATIIVHLPYSLHLMLLFW